MRLIHDGPSRSSNGHRLLAAKLWLLPVNSRPQMKLSSNYELFEQQLRARILVMDGAMGTMIQDLKLTEADFRGSRFRSHTSDLKGNNELLSLTQPEAIRDIHLKYLQSGADIIETNTFTANRVSQADYNLQDYSREINLEAAKLARQAVAEITSADKPRFVAGAVGPTTRTTSLSPDVNDPGFRSVTFDDLVVDYSEAIHALIEGGVDIILIETIFDVLNSKAAIFAALSVFLSYVVVSMRLLPELPSSS